MHHDTEGQTFPEGPKFIHHLIRTRRSFTEDRLLIGASGFIEQGPEAAGSR